jgi:hypothetical protein
MSFSTLPHARIAPQVGGRPHGKLGGLTPTSCAARWTDDEELEQRPSGVFDDFLVVAG